MGAEESGCIRPTEEAYAEKVDAEVDAMRIVNCRKESYTKYIGRGSDFGNPFTELPLARTKALVQVADGEAVSCFERWAGGDKTWDGIIPPSRRTRLLAAIKSLKADDVLGCFGCKPCHGEAINRLWRTSTTER